MMSDAYLSAPVPRRLRLNASVQLAGVRMPARAFLLTVGCIAFGGIAITLGVAIERAIWGCGGCIALGVTLLEGRLWGRSSRAIAAIVWRHFYRPKRLRPGRPWVALPLERPALAVTARRPRWQIEEAQDE